MNNNKGFTLIELMTVITIIGIIIIIVTTHLSLEKRYADTAEEEMYNEYGELIELKPSNIQYKRHKLGSKVQDIGEYCIDGYVWVYRIGNSPTLQQFYVRDVAEGVVPKQCKASDYQGE